MTSAGNVYKKLRDQHLAAEDDEQLPKQLQEELTRLFGTFDVGPHQLMRIMFMLVNNLTESPPGPDTIGHALLICQKFAILHDIPFTISKLNW